VTLGPEQVRALACPHDGDGIWRDGASLRCPAGHAFDIARQGYVNLVAGRDPGTGDDAAMVDAREQVLTSGLFDQVTQVLGERVLEVLVHHLYVERDVDRVLVDLGGGTGHHLAGVLERLPQKDHGQPQGHGLSLDLSKAAAKRAAQRHPRLGAVVADVWQRLPLRDAVASAVLCVFAPRNAAEIARILRPDGVFVLATPDPHHLGELVDPLGLIAVDPRKDERVTASVTAHLVTAGTTHVHRSRPLDRAAVRSLVAMGPSADHIPPEELDRRVTQLPEPTRVTLGVEVRTFRRR
jgi:23S rRNA (guanine745-N1)-methyltransferase